MLEKAWLRVNGKGGAGEVCVEFDFTQKHQHHFRGFEVTHCYNDSGDESIKILEEATGMYERIHIKTGNSVEDALMNLDNTYKFINHFQWKLVQVNTSHWIWNMKWMRKEVAE